MEEWERNTRRYVWEEERTPNSVQKLRNKFNGGRGKDVGEIFEWKVCFTYYGAKSGPLFKRRIIPRINSRRGTWEKSSRRRSTLTRTAYYYYYYYSTASNRVKSARWISKKQRSPLGGKFRRSPTDFRLCGKSLFSKPEGNREEISRANVFRFAKLWKREREKRKKDIYIYTDDAYKYIFRWYFTR